MIKLLMLLAGRDLLVRYRLVIALLAASGLLLAAMIALDLAIDGHINISASVLAAVLLLSLLFNLLSGETSLQRWLNLLFSLIFIGTLVVGLIWHGDGRQLKKLIFAVMEVCLLCNGLFRCLSAALIQRRRWARHFLLGCGEMVLGGVLFFSGHDLHGCLLLGGWLIFLLLSFSLTIWRVYRQWQRLPDGDSLTLLPCFCRGHRHMARLKPWLQTPFPSDSETFPLYVHVWQAQCEADKQPRRYVIDRYIGVINGAGEFCTGHAALSFGQHGYISLYPLQEIEPAREALPRLLLAGQINDRPGRFLPSLAAEVAGWRSPDITLSFARYNRRALANYWHANGQDSLYNLTAKNCSTTVIDAVDVALEGYLSQRLRIVTLLLQPAFWGACMLRERAEIMTWTPGLVADYVRMLKKTLGGYPGR